MRGGATSTRAEPRREAPIAWVRLDENTTSTDPSVRALREALEAAASPEKAPEMARYLRNRFEFLGLGAPERRAAQSEFVKTAVAQEPQRSLALAHALWEEPEREFQYVACDLLRRVSKRLEPGDLHHIRSLVTARSWWDTVDSLARVVGDVVRTHPALSAEMDRWIRDDDMWVVRVAILHQLGWKEQARPEVVFRYCAQQADHPDFFVRKAIGWALRDLARAYPHEVWAWVDAHPELSGLSRRAATKHR